jgi:hypothetical protein
LGIGPQPAWRLDRFDRDQTETALAFWYEIHKGVHESLREF